MGDNLTQRTVALSQRFWSPQENGPPGPNSSRDLVRGTKCFCGIWSAHAYFPFLGRRSLSSCHVSRIKRTMACNQASLVVKDAESERQERQKGAGRAHVYEYLTHNCYPEVCDKNHNAPLQQAVPFYTGYNDVL